MKLEQDKVYIIQQALLGGWFCIPDDMPEDTALTKIISLVNEREALLLEIPVSDPELVRDRLFGGFKCAEDENRRHVYFALGCYTFINSEKNTPLSAENRKEIWDTLTAKEHKNNFCGGTNFTKDAPPPIIDKDFTADIDWTEAEDMKQEIQKEGDNG